jgi:spermidine synthase
MMEIDILTHPTDQDIADLIGLYVAASWWGGSTDNSDLVRAIVAGSHVFVTARHEGRIIGMGRAISDRVSDAYLQDITVLERYRGQGLAKKILQKLIERLTSDKIFWIALIAERGSSGLYERVGFKPMENSTPMWRLDARNGL